MIDLRYAFVCVIVFSSLGRLSAQTPNPFGVDEQFNADLVITMAKGPTLKETLYAEHGNLRIKSTMKGVTIVTLVLPEIKKCYQLQPGKDRIEEIPLSASGFKEQMFTSLQHGTVTLQGSETTEGIPCDKFKVTMVDGDKGTYIVWRDSKTKAPVKIEAPDHSFALLWKNYEVGPQAASLFKVPTDYTMVKSPITAPVNKQ